VSRARDVGELDHTINLPMILAGFLRSRLKYEQHIELCEIAYRAAKSSGTEGDLAKLSLAQATTAMRAGDFQLALSMSDRSFCHAAEAVDWEAAASALDTEAVVLRHLGHADRALEKHDKAARMLERIGSHVRSARAHINAGNTLRVLGRKEEALRRFELAMDVYRRFDETRSYIRASLNLAGLYQELGKPLEAASHLAMVREFSRDGVEPHVLATACTQLGVILCEGGIMDEGEEALIEARDTYRMLDEPRGLNQVLGLLAQVYGHTHRPEEAEQARREASTLSDRRV
jgi:tetratricopeptide (TPR) repeat protein